jgi:hypothetical protein
MNPFKLADGSKRRGVDFESSKRAAPEARVSSQPTPLTGRETELSLLKDRWEQAQEGMGQVVLVIGEAGLGKSRLVQTLAQSVEEAGDDSCLEPAQGERAPSGVNQLPILIEWRCSEQFQNSELYPVTDCLERFLGSGA